LVTASLRHAWARARPLRRAARTSCRWSRHWRTTGESDDGEACRNPSRPPGSGCSSRTGSPWSGCAPSTPCSSTRPARSPWAGRHGRRHPPRARIATRCSPWPPPWRPTANIRSDGRSWRPRGRPARAVDAPRASVRSRARGRGRRRRLHSGGRWARAPARAGPAGPPRTSGSRRRPWAARSAAVLHVVRDGVVVG